MAISRGDMDNIVCFSCSRRRSHRMMHFMRNDGDETSKCSSEESTSIRIVQRSSSSPMSMIMLLLVLISGVTSCSSLQNDARTSTGSSLFVPFSFVDTSRLLSSSSTSSSLSIASFKRKRINSSTIQEGQRLNFPKQLPFSVSGGPLFMKKKKKGPAGSNNNTRTKAQLATKRLHKAMRKEERLNNQTRSNGKVDKQQSNTKSSKKKSTLSSKVTLPQQGRAKGTPPWQVLSPKAAERNAELLKARRDALARGEDDPGLINLDDDDEFVVDTTKRDLSDADRLLLGWKSFNPSIDVGGMAYIGSYLGTRSKPIKLGVPEVAFLGRSNVGKSSLLNKLLSLTNPSDEALASDKARVGKTPGATASVNLYALLGKQNSGSLKKNNPSAFANVQSGGQNRPILGFVDLPGFGYAKLSKDVKQSVEEAAETYLSKRKELGLAVLLVDARRIPSDDDRAVLAALYDLGIPLCVVATKIDKLNKNELESAMANIQQGLGLPEGQPLRISNQTGQGIKELWTILMDACVTRVEELNEAAQAGTSLEKAGSLKKEDDDATSSTFDDDEDLVYDQGYDWVHGRVMLEEDEEDFDEEWDDEEEDDNVDYYGP